VRRLQSKEVFPRDDHLVPSTRIVAAMYPHTQTPDTIHQEDDLITQTVCDGRGKEMQNRNEPTSFPYVCVQRKKSLVMSKSTTTVTTATPNGDHTFE